MKTRMLGYALVAAGLLCGSTFIASAQQGGGGGGRAMILSQEDMTAVRDATREDMAKFNTDLQAARKAAVEAALAKEVNEADLKAKLEAVSKIEVQRALAYCKAVKKTVKLTDEQVTQIKESAMGYMTLFGGGFGGMGGGRGRRGGGGGGGGQ